MFLSNFTLLLINHFFLNSTTVMLYPTYKNSKGSNIYINMNKLWKLNSAKSMPSGYT